MPQMSAISGCRKLLCWACWHCTSVFWRAWTLLTSIMCTEQQMCTLLRFSVLVHIATDCTMQQVSRIEILSHDPWCLSAGNHMCLQYPAVVEACCFVDIWLLGFRITSAPCIDLQVKYPENFFLLRGNHECASINRIYGFYDECKRRYNIRLWKTFTDCFNCLPVAALVDEKVGLLVPCSSRHVTPTCLLFMQLSSHCSKGLHLTT